MEYLCIFQLFFILYWQTGISTVRAQVTGRTTASTRQPGSSTSKNAIAIEVNGTRQEKPPAPVILVNQTPAGTRPPAAVAGLVVVNSTNSSVVASTLAGNRTNTGNITTVVSLFNDTSEFTTTVTNTSLSGNGTTQTTNVTIQTSNATIQMGNGTIQIENVTIQTGNNTTVTGSTGNGTTANLSLSVTGNVTSLTTNTTTNITTGNGVSTISSDGTTSKNQTVSVASIEVNRTVANASAAGNVTLVTTIAAINMADGNGNNETTPGNGTSSVNVGSINATATGNNVTVSTGNTTQGANSNGTIGNAGNGTNGLSNVTVNMVVDSNTSTGGGNDTANVITVSITATNGSTVSLNSSNASSVSVNGVNGTMASQNATNGTTVLLNFSSANVSVSGSLPPGNASLPSASNGITNGGARNSSAEGISQVSVNVTSSSGSGVQPQLIVNASMGPFPVTIQPNAAAAPNQSQFAQQEPVLQATQGPATTNATSAPVSSGATPAPRNGSSLISTTVSQTGGVNQSATNSSGQQSASGQSQNATASQQGLQQQLTAANVQAVPSSGNQASSSLPTSTVGPLQSSATQQPATNGQGPPSDGPFPSPTVQIPVYVERASTTGPPTAQNGNTVAEPVKPTTVGGRTQALQISTNNSVASRPLNSDIVAQPQSSPNSIPIPIPAPASSGPAPLSATNTTRPSISIDININLNDRQPTLNPAGNLTPSNSAKSPPDNTFIFAIPTTQSPQSPITTAAPMVSNTTAAPIMLATTATAPIPDTTTPPLAPATTAAPVPAATATPLVPTATATPLVPTATAPSPPLTSTLASAATGVQQPAPVVFPRPQTANGSDPATVIENQPAVSSAPNGSSSALSTTHFPSVQTGAAISNHSIINAVGLLPEPLPVLTTNYNATGAQTGPSQTLCLQLPNELVKLVLSTLSEMGVSIQQVSSSNVTATNLSTSLTGGPTGLQSQPAILQSHLANGSVTNHSLATQSASSLMPVPMPTPTPSLTPTPPPTSTSSTTASLVPAIILGVPMPVMLPPSSQATLVQFSPQPASTIAPAIILQATATPPALPAATGLQTTASPVVTAALQPTVLVNTAAPSGVVAAIPVTSTSNAQALVSVPSSASPASSPVVPVSLSGSQTAAPQAANNTQALAAQATPATPNNAQNVPLQAALANANSSTQGTDTNPNSSQPIPSPPNNVQNTAPASLSAINTPPIPTILPPTPAAISAPSAGGPSSITNASGLLSAAPGSSSVNPVLQSAALPVPSNNPAQAANTLAQNPSVAGSPGMNRPPSETAQVTPSPSVPSGTPLAQSNEPVSNNANFGLPLSALPNSGGIQAATNVQQGPGPQLGQTAVNPALNLIPTVAPIMNMVPQVTPPQPAPQPNGLPQNGPTLSNLPQNSIVSAAPPQTNGGSNSPQPSALPGAAPEIRIPPYVTPQPTPLIFTSLLPPVANSAYATLGPYGIGSYGILQPGPPVPPSPPAPQGPQPSQTQGPQSSPNPANPYLQAGQSPSYPVITSATAAAPQTVPPTRSPPVLAPGTPPPQPAPTATPPSSAPASPIGRTISPGQRPGAVPASSNPFPVMQVTQPPNPPLVNSIVTPATLPPSGAVGSAYPYAVKPVASYAISAPAAAAAIPEARQNEPTTSRSIFDPPPGMSVIWKAVNVFPLPPAPDMQQVQGSTAALRSLPINVMTKKALETTPGAAVPAPVSRPRVAESPKNAPLTQLRDLCDEKLEVDAVTETSDGVLHVFVGDKVYMVKQKAGFKTGSLHDIWPGIGKKVQRLSGATTTTQEDGTTFLFTENEYWKFDRNHRLATDSPKPITAGFPGIQNVDTVFHDPRNNGDIYFIQGNQYVISNHRKFPITRGPFPISRLGLGGTGPNKLNAAFNDRQSGQTIFVAGPAMYRVTLFTDSSGQETVGKLEPGYPRPFREYFPC